MYLFFMLFAACIVGGFLLTSVIWVLFWMVGVFEIPEGVKATLRIVSTPRYQRIEPSPAVRANFCVVPERQAGLASTLALARLGGSSPVLGGNSISQLVASLSQSGRMPQISPDTLNAVQPHAFAPN